MNDQYSQTFWDRIGIWLSGLCALHCLFFPVAVALLPLWPSAYTIHDWTHPLLFVLILPTVFFALRGEVNDRRIPRLLYSGLVVVGLAWMLHDWIGSAGEVAVTILGSGLLVSGHWFNYLQHRNHCEKDTEYEEA